MPVHERHYEPYTGALESSAVRLLAIPRYTIEVLFTRMLAFILFGLGSIVMLVFAVYLFLQINMDLLKLIGMDGLPELSAARIFYLLLSIQVLPAIVVLVLTIPKVIGPDRRNGALALVFARPISRVNYITGKVGALAILLATLTVLQVCVLFLLMIGMMPEGSSFRTEFWSGSLALFGKALFCAAAICVTLSLVGAACSAVSKNRVAGSVIFLMLVFGSRVSAEVVAGTSGMSRPYFGLDDCLSTLCTILLVGDSDRSLLWVIFHLGLWCVASLAVLWKALRPVEVFRE